MILVTVGGQMAFDRLVLAVDAWAGSRGRTDVRAQIGPSSLRPEHLRYERFVPPDRFQALVQEADAIVAHAGMGTILTALEIGKPIIVMPRRGDLRETRNDHQVATAQALGQRPGITVAMTEDDLPAALDAIGSLSVPDRISAHASDRLLNSLRDFLNQ